jgi:hypothetical protein
MRTLQDFNNKNKPIDEMVEENMGFVTSDSGPYLEIDWYAEDHNPEEKWFDTDLGPNPKIQVTVDGTVYLRTDISRFSKS